MENDLNPLPQDLYFKIRSCADQLGNYPIILV